MVRAFLVDSMDPAKMVYSCGASMESSRLHATDLLKHNSKFFFLFFIFFGFSGHVSFASLISYLKSFSSFCSFPEIA
jgi:hypothetical protein